MSDAPIQRSLAELQRMPPEEVVRAHKAGELDELVRGRDPAAPLPPREPTDAEPVSRGDADQGARPGGPKGQLSDSDVKTLYAEGRVEEITRAHREGRCDVLIGKRR